MNDHRDPRSSPPPPSAPTAKATVKAPGPVLGPRDNQPRPPPTKDKEDLPKDIPTPVLRGRVFEILDQATGRTEMPAEPLLFPYESDPVAITATEHKAAIALAGILAFNLMRHSGSRLSTHALEGVMRRILPTLRPRELMEIEIEAYEIMAWLGRSLRPGIDDLSQDTPQDGPSIPYDPESAKIDLIQRALDEGFDLTMMYYTGGRGEMLARRVTPRGLVAEKYLHAYCHTREEVRVFRLSRIGRIMPVGGRPIERPELPKAKNGSQWVLFGDED